MNLIKLFPLSKENKLVVESKVKKGLIPVFGSLLVISILHKTGLGVAASNRIIDLLQPFFSSSSQPSKTRNSEINKTAKKASRKSTMPTGNPEEKWHPTVFGENIPDS